jgi:hypothetical protein
MSPIVEKIEEEFKKLPVHDQADLLDRLESVFGQPSEDDAFIEALKRRVNEIESGQVKGRDAFEVLNEIKTKHSARSPSPCTLGLSPSSGSR